MSCGFRELRFAVPCNPADPGYDRFTLHAASSEKVMISAVAISLTREAKTIRNITLHFGNFGYKKMERSELRGL
jgi:hypothetical protein